MLSVLWRMHRIRWRCLSLSVCVCVYLHVWQSSSRHAGDAQLHTQNNQTNKRIRERERIEKGDSFKRGVIEEAEKKKNWRGSVLLLFYFWIVRARIAGFDQLFGLPFSFSLDPFAVVVRTGCFPYSPLAPLTPIHVFCRFLFRPLSLSVSKRMCVGTHLARWNHCAAFLSRTHNCRQQQKKRMSSVLTHNKPLPQRWHQPHKRISNRIYLFLSLSFTNTLTQTRLCSFFFFSLFLCDCF